MKTRRDSLVSLLFAALCFTAPLAANSEITRTHASDALFAPDRLIQVEIEMAPEDWQALRISHRVTGEDFSQVVENPYEYYQAKATIDGQVLHSVGIRKKGFFGSAISTRPSLKLKLDRYVDDQAFSGLSTLTFNNNNQDASRLQSFMVYRFLNEAGVNSPRANFARIIVNGEDLGIYTHVESVDKALVKRLYGKAKGDLWEGYAGDFTEADFNRIVHKMGKDDDSESLQKLYDLLQVPEPIPLEAFGQLIDLDAFISLWASEVLIGHWDGYASNRNNYYIYREPKSGLFYFIPWGPDSAFWDPGPFLPAGLPKSFKARGYLCQRLWELPEVRSRYRKEMQRLLNDVWNEKQMLADMQQAASWIQAYSTASVEAAERNTASIRNFITTRRGEVQSELDVPAVDWPKSESKGVAGPGAVMEVVGRFSSIYAVSAAEPDREPASDTLNLFANVPSTLLGTGTADIEFTVDGEMHKPFTHYGARTTPGDPDFIRKGYPVIELIASSDSGHPPWRLTLTMDPYQLSEGKNTLAVDHFTVWALLSQGDPGAEDAQTTAFGISGELELDEFSRTPGAEVSGRFRLKTAAFKDTSLVPDSGH
jgi:spore coat protein CotH